MKKIVLFIFLSSSISSINAQYKKASFLQRDGRTFEIGTDLRVLTDGRSPQTGIHFSFGREMPKRFFYWYDFEITLPSKFKTLATLNESSYYTTYPKVEVTGKSRTGLIFRLNFGYFLKDDADEANKLLPFITLGLHYKIMGLGFSLDKNPNSTGYTSYYEISDGSPNGASGSGGINLGIGGLYNLTQKIGLKLHAGYNYEISAEGKFNNGAIDVVPYNHLNSHPYVTLGVRYRINRDD